MKNLKYLVLMSVITMACQTNRGNNIKKEEVIENLTPDQFEVLVKKNPKALIDVRTLDEFKTGYIPGATLVDIYDSKFTDKIKNLNIGDTLLLYCRSGGRSSKAANTLKDFGFKKIYNLSGGIGAWKSENKEITEPEISQTEDQYDLKSFHALLDNKSVQLVDFNSSWCSPCLAMKPKVEALSNQFPNQVHILDIDKNKTLVEHFKIMSIPTYIVFKDGQEVKRANGILNEEQLSNLLNL